MKVLNRNNGKLTEFKKIFSYAEQVAVFFLGLGTFFLALSPLLCRNSLILAATPVIVSSEVGASELLEANDGIILKPVTPETIIDALEKIKSTEYKPERDFVLR